MRPSTKGAISRAAAYNARDAAHNGKDGDDDLLDPQNHCVPPRIVAAARHIRAQAQCYADRGRGVAQRGANLVGIVSVSMVPRLATMAVTSTAFTAAARQVEACPFSKSRYPRFQNTSSSSPVRSRCRRTRVVAPLDVLSTSRSSDPDDSSTLPYRRPPGVLAMRGAEWRVVSRWLLSGSQGFATHHVAPCAGRSRPRSRQRFPPHWPWPCISPPANSTSHTTTKSVAAYADPPTPSPGPRTSRPAQEAVKRNPDVVGTHEGVDWGRLLLRDFWGKPLFADPSCGTDHLCWRTAGANAAHVSLRAGTGWRRRNWRSGQ